MQRAQKASLPRYEECVIFGIAEELSSDGGPEFKAGTTETFLHNWGVLHRVSSVANPHSNCRAEIGVKTVKRLLAGSTGPGGTLNSVQKDNGPRVKSALLKSSLDAAYVTSYQCRPDITYRIGHGARLAAREDALRVRHMRTHERLSEHTRAHPHSPSVTACGCRIWSAHILPSGTVLESSPKCDSMTNTSYEWTGLGVSLSTTVSTYASTHRMINLPSVIPPAKIMPLLPIGIRTETPQLALPQTGLADFMPPTPVPATPAKHTYREMSQPAATPPPPAAMVLAPTPAPPPAARHLRPQLARST